MVWRRFWRSYFVHIIEETLQVPCTKQCNHTQMTFGNYYQCTDTLHESQREVGRHLTDGVTEQKTAKQFVVLKKIMPGMSKITEHCVYQPNPKVLSLPVTWKLPLFILHYNTRQHLCSQKKVSQRANKVSDVKQNVYEKDSADWLKRHNSFNVMDMSSVIWEHRCTKTRVL